MTMNSQMVVSLSRLLALLRPDWDLSGTHAAVTELAADPRPTYTLCRQAIDRASIAANRSPTSVTWLEQHKPLEQEAPRCELHGSDVRRLDGRWHCCVLENQPDHVVLNVQPRPVPIDLSVTRETLKNAIRSGK